jgi:hypothetical protein
MTEGLPSFAYATTQLDHTTFSIAGLQSLICGKIAATDLFLLGGAKNHMFSSEMQLKEGLGRRRRAEIPRS